MGAGDLKASLSLNSSQYEQAIARADAKATAFANKVQGDLSKKIGKMFGAGAAAGFLFKPLNDLREGLFGGGERASEIAKQAESLHLTAEEYQMAAAAAESHNMTLEEWFKHLKESKTPLQDVIAEMESFRGAVRFTNDAIKNLTDNSLIEWVQNLGNKLAQLKSGIVDGLARAFAQLAVFMDQPDKFTNPIAARDRAWKQVLEDEAKQNELQKTMGPSGGLAAAVSAAADPTKRQSTALASARGSLVQLNELQRIGAYAGSAGDPAQKSLDKIAENTNQAAKAAVQSNDSLKRLAESAGIFRGHGAGGQW